MKTPFHYRDDKDRTAANHQRNTTLSWLDNRVSDLLSVHGKIKHRQGLTAADLNLLDIVLNTVVSNIFHDRAEAEFFGLENDSGRKPDKPSGV